jgi:hypothetical protein
MPTQHRYARITATTGGAVAAEPNPCTCLCQFFHPEHDTVCTTKAEPGAERCVSCVEVDVDTEAEELDWLNYQEVTQTGVEAIA